MARRSPTPRWLPKRRLWQMDAQYKGNRKSFYSSDSSKKTGPAECRRKWQAWKDEIDNPAGIRFADAWDEFIKFYINRNRKSSTKAVQAHGKAHLMPRFEHIPVKKIQKSDWQAVIDAAFLDGAKSFYTLKSISGTIRTFCRFCAGKGWIEDAAVPIHFSYPVKKTKPEKRALTQNEFKILLSDEALAENWYVPVFRFLAFSGLRRGEVCALKDKDLVDGYLFIYETVSHDQDWDRTKSEDSDRGIKLIPLATAAIETHRKLKEKYNIKSQWLFCKPDGSFIPPRVLRNNWQKWRELHNIEITLHELRHTFISYTRRKSEINLDDLKSIVGHSAAMATDKVYSHPLGLSEAEIQKKLEKDKENADLINAAFLSSLEIDT